MRNQYLKNLKKIEFVITDACTGHCKHCSQGDHRAHAKPIDADLAISAIRKICDDYDIQTVMVFGGEPLLYAEVACSIIKSATELGIPHRQIITNGYFSKNDEKISRVAKILANSGVNDLLLSVDAFHQEYIPLDIVKKFATEAAKCGIPIRLQPAWLVSQNDENPYNVKTREILNSFDDINLSIGEGNVIFPEGNALKYLSEYFKLAKSANPYIEDPSNLYCISFSSNGDVLNGNIYSEDIDKIMDEYSPNT